MYVKVKMNHQLAKLPVKATPNSAAFDITATEIIEESPGKVLVKTGLHFEFDPQYRLMITPRSSLTKTNWIILNSPGIGDPDFRGEYCIRFTAIPINWGRQIIMVEDKNQSMKVVEELDEFFIPENNFSTQVEDSFIFPEFPYKVGERFAQIYWAPVLDTYFEQVSDLSETVRGSGGFGSTGK